MASEGQSTIGQYFKKSEEESSRFVKKSGHEDCDGAGSSVECPMCGAGLARLSHGLRNAHVNRCLEQVLASGNDGAVEVEVDEVEVETTASSSTLVATSMAKTVTKRKPESPPETPDIDKPKRAKKTMPFYKVVEIGGQKFGVDAFSYGTIPEVDILFLTHFHSDHYGGLSKHWNSGLIYCTEATARLCELHLDLPSEWLRPVKMNEWTTVNGIEVLFVDANHCPGAAIILFKFHDKTILHTGDFRACWDQVERLKPYTIDVLYLDTTYLAPLHCFPDQQDVIKACGHYAIQLRDADKSSSFLTATIDRFFKKEDSKNNRPLILVGTYTIGKERLAIHIAQRLGTKIFARRQKKQTLLAIGDPELTDMLDDNGWECDVHLVSMRDLNMPQLQSYFKPLSKTFTHCLAFIPTGWTFRPPKSALEEPRCPEFTSQNLFKSRQVQGKVHLFRVPYSEHSSYTELQMFCTNLDIKQVIPTVNTNSTENVQRMHQLLDNWTL